jgi:hypothetical protein
VAPTESRDDLKFKISDFKYAKGKGAGPEAGGTNSEENEAAM